MKRILILGLCICIIALTACSVKPQTALLCVSDDSAATPAPAFSLKADIPDDALALNDTNAASVLYEQGDYEMISETFFAQSAAEGLEKITGKTADSIQIMHLNAFPQEEYRFSWTAAGEDGDLTCCGTMFFDGNTCYALSFQCPSALENRYRSTFYHILSNAELQPV